MTPAKSQTLIDRTIFLSLIFLTIGLPLIKSSRVAIFTVVVSLLVLAWLVLNRNKSLLLDGKFMLILVFLALATLATAFSISRTTSAFGVYHREGLLTYLVLALTYLLAIQVEWDKKKIKVILSVTVYVAAFISTLAIYRYGYRLLTIEQMTYLDRARTLVGPNVLSFYLTLVWPLALRLFLFDDTSRREKIVFGFSSLVILGANILTFTRTGWAISAIIFVLMVVMSNRKKQIMKIAAMLAVVVLLAGIFTGTQKSRDINFNERFMSIFKIDALAPRTVLWKPAVKMIRDKPLMGYGPKTYPLALRQQDSVTLAQFQGKPKTPHNYLLNIALTLGIPALVVMMFIFVLGIAQGFASRDYFKQTLSLSIIAMLLSGLFLEWPVFLMFPLWLFLAINTGKKFPMSANVWLKGGLAVLVLGLIAVTGLQWTAENYYQKSRTASRKIVQTDYLNRAIDLNPYMYLYWRDYVQLNADRSPEKRIEIIKQAQSYHPLREELVIAEALVRWRNRNNVKPEGVLELVDQAIALRPFNAKSHYVKGRILFRKKQFLEAAEEFRLSMLVDPRHAEVYTALIFRAREANERRERNILDKQLKWVRDESPES